MGYKEDLQIEFYNLENNLIEQPGLYMKYAQEGVNINEKKDRLKQELEVLKSNLDAKLRGNFEEYGFEKSPTEAAVKAWINKNDKIITISTDIIELQRESGIISAALVALEHRKKSLQGLVQLYAAGWFAEVKTPSEVKDKLGATARRKVNEEKLEDNERLKKLKRRE